MARRDEATRSNFRIVLLPGVLFTILVVVVDLLGGLSAWERLTIDWRFRMVPRPSRPMSDSIVHVDIDDGALEIVGRWPWDRGLVADAIQELATAGARTLAIDLIFTEPSKPRDEKEDTALATSIEKIATLVPVEIHEGKLFDPVWLEPGAADEMVRLLRALAGNIQIEMDEAIKEAGVTGPRRARFMNHHRLFLKAAAWATAFRQGDALASFEDFENLLAPNRSRFVDHYAEQKILEAVWRQHEAWKAAKPFLIPDKTSGTFLDDATIPVFMRSASGVGFVNVDQQKHSDGVVREITASLPAPGGSAVQFGLAAAALHRGHKPQDIKFLENRILIGGIELPLTSTGKLWIHWPTSETDPPWEGLLRQGPNDPEAHGHLSIRELVDLAQGRRDQVINRGKLAKVTGLILEFADVEFEPGEELVPSNLEAAVEEAEFVLSDLEDLEGEEDRAFLDHVHNCQLFTEQKEAVAEGVRLIKLVESTLAEKVEDKLVFLGWTATGALADFVPTTLDSRTPGVVVHAAVANMALTGNALRFAPTWTRPLLALLMGILCTVTASRSSAIRSAIVAGATLTIYTCIMGMWLFNQDSIFPMTAPLLAGFLSWVGCTALQSALSQRDRIAIMRQFKARVSQQLVNHLVHDPKAVTVLGEEREVAVMFTDLQGFTTVSETLGGRATVSTLNRYLSALSHELTAEDAYVNKFLGDGVMAFWSAFSIDVDQGEKACRAAVRCQEVVNQLNSDPATEGIPPLQLRVGVATGKVIVGDCGAPPELHDYTVIGDAVNLASRLESANKQFGTQTLIDGRTRESIADQDVLVRGLGQIVVVGQTKPVEVFQVLPDDASRDWIKVTEEMVASFAAGRLVEALKALDVLEKSFGATCLQETFRQAIELAEDDFDGVLWLRAK